MCRTKNFTRVSPQSFKIFSQIFPRVRNLVHTLRNVVMNTSMKGNSLHNTVFLSPFPTSGHVTEPNTKFCPPLFSLASLGIIASKSTCAFVIGLVKWPLVGFYMYMYFTQRRCKSRFYMYHMSVVCIHVLVHAYVHVKSGFALNIGLLANSSQNCGGLFNTLF